MYQRNQENLSGLFDTITKIASGVAQGSQAVTQIASGTYTPYPGSPPVLYANPAYQAPAATPAPTAAGGSIPTGLLLGAAGLLGVVLVMMRSGRR